MVFSVCFDHSAFDCCCVAYELSYSFLSVCHFSTTGACSTKELIRSSDGSLLSLTLCSSWPPLVFPLYLESNSLHQICPRCVNITFPLAFICNPLWLGLVGVWLTTPAPPQSHHVLSLLLPFIFLLFYLAGWHLGQFLPKDTYILIYHIFSKFLFAKKTILFLTVCWISSALCLCCAFFQRLQVLLDTDLIWSEASWWVLKTTPLLQQPLNPHPSVKTERKTWDCQNLLRGDRSDRVKRALLPLKVECTSARGSCYAPGLHFILVL